MVKYNTKKSFADNMDALSSELEEQRKEHLGTFEEDGKVIVVRDAIDQTDKWLVAVIDHVLNGIDHAKDLYKADPVEAVCEVANAIIISLCDEVNIGGLLKPVRTDVFGYDDSGDAFSNIHDYINCMLGTVGPEKIMKGERRCSRCHQKYWFYFPILWNDGRRAEVIRMDTRRTNTNASYEFLCLSGLCDACWQVCFNKAEKDD